MPSVNQNAEMLKKMKEENLLMEKVNMAEEVTPSRPNPDTPTYPAASNSRLRTPMPAITNMQPDTQRQFFNAAIPQTRIFPLTTASSPFVGATIQSSVFTFAVPIIPVPVVPIFPPPTTQLYEVNNNGIFEQIYSVNGVLIP